MTRDAIGTSLPFQGVLFLWINGNRFSTGRLLVMRAGGLARFD